MTSEPQQLVSGPRVFLRHPVESDRAAWIELRRASRQFLERWEPLPVGGVDPFGNTGFDRYLHEADVLHRQRHLVCLHDGALVGHAGLSEIARGPFQNAIMGYWIGQCFARQGLMTEAIGLCLRRAFTDLGLHRVEANVIPRNTASKRTAERAGFRHEGYSSRYLEIAGVWEDHERYAMTREDWVHLPSAIAIEPEQLEAWHKHSSGHRDVIANSDTCGCFYCLATFRPEEIQDWLDSAQTAQCPRCGIDSVIGSRSGIPLTDDVLRAMRRFWFSSHARPAPP